MLFSVSGSLLGFFLGFTEFLPGFSWVSLRFYRLLLGFTGFSWVVFGFDRVCTGFDLFYSVFISFTELFFIIINFTIQFLLGFTGFYWVFLGFTEFIPSFYWVSTGYIFVELFFLLF